MTTHRPSSARSRYHIEAVESRVLLAVNLTTDINPVPYPVPAPGPVTQSNGQFFYAVNDSVLGTELWKTDGTAAGTQLVRDINLAGNSSPSEMRDVNGTLYFAADDGVHGRELWKSDGTAAGTSMVADALAGPESSAPYGLTAFNGTLLFFGLRGNSTADYGLYRTDGTAAGTVFLKSLYSTYGQLGTEAVVFSNRVYFIDGGFTTGGELWRSDGTLAGTQPVTAFPNSSPAASKLTVVNGRLVFIAGSPEAGSEIWASDGTAQGTAMLRDIRPGTSGSDIANFCVVGNQLFFTANDGTNGVELWKTDGTPGGTVLVKDIVAGSSSSNPGYLAGLNGSLYFAATASNFDRELWKSDGTAAGTNMLANLAAAFSSTPQNITSVGNRLYFVASSNVAVGLWTSDGTAIGTKFVIATDQIYTYPPTGFIAGPGSQALFTAYDAVAGLEYFTTDGTSAGTHVIGDVNRATSPSEPQKLGVVGTTYLFFANDGVHGYELWRSDGTAAGTQLVQDIRPGVNSSMSGIAGTLSIVIGNTLYFIADDGTRGPEVWKSDGTNAGTSIVKDIEFGSTGNGPLAFASLGGSLYFAQNGRLYRSDGTETGTVLLKFFDNFTNAFWLTPFGNKLLFTAYSNSAGAELWQTDGTPAGTGLLKDIAPGTASSSPSNFKQSGSRTYFFASPTAGNETLWITDGTAAGTTMVKDIAPNSDDLDSNTIGTLPGGRIVFSVWLSQFGIEPWVSDGTAAGTFRIKDINPGPAHAFPEGFTDLNGFVLFEARQGSTRALWRTDGTDAGTYKVHVADPTYMINTNGFAYFSADDPVQLPHGIYRSDGTTAGTVPISAFGNTVTVAGNNLFFSYPDPTYGTELFRATLDASSPVITAQEFRRTDGGDELRFTADRALLSSRPWQDLIVQNLSTQQTIAPPNILRRYSNQDRTVTFTFPGFDDARLPDGHYRATLPFGGVVAVDGTPTNTDSAIEFFVVGGSVANDRYYLRAGAMPDTVSVFKNVDPIGTPTFVLPLADLSGLWFSGSAGDDLFDYNAFLPVPIHYSGGTGMNTLAISGGTLTLSEDVGSPSLNMSILVTGGTLNLGTSQHLTTLNIAATGLAVLTASAPSLIRCTQIDVAGRLDLNSGSLIVDYAGSSPLASVASLIATARAGGAWTGNGITSTSAKSATPKNTTLAAMESGDFKSIYGDSATFAGEAIDTTAVLVKYTYYGDTDFNGVVNFDDYSRTDSGFNNGRSGWLNGDFDGNGVVDFDDYSLIDLAFNTQGSARRAGASRRIK